MRFGWLAAAAAMVSAGSARADTITQTFYSSFTQVGSTGAVQIGRLGLAPNQAIRSATVSYIAETYASIDFTAYAGAANTGVITYSGSAGFYISDLSVPVFASASFSGANPCAGGSGGTTPTTGTCSALYSFAGTVPISEVNLAAFATTTPLLLAASGGINYAVTYNGEPAPLQQRYTGYSVRGTITYDVGAIPEPASWAMMILGIGIVGAVSRRRGRTALA